MHITKHFSFQAKPNQHIPIVAYTIKAVPKFVEQILQKHKLKITYNRDTCNKPKQSRLDCLDELRTKPSQTLIVVIFTPNQTKP